MECTKQLSILKTLNINLWITANAGSGKTTQLVNRFLFLLQNGIKPEEIVCITYTEAGAKEMKDRIISIAKQHNLNIKEHQLNISTIHAYCLKLLTTNKILPENIKILNNDKYTVDKIITKIENNIDEILEKKSDDIVENFIISLAKTESFTSFQRNIKDIINNQLWFFNLFDSISNKKTESNILESIDLSKISQLLPKSLQHFVGKMPEIHSKGLALQQELQKYDVEVLFKEIQNIIGKKNEKELSNFIDNNGNVLQQEIRKIKNWKNIVLTKSGKPRKSVEKSNFFLIKEIQQYFLDGMCQLGVDATYSMLCFAYYVLREYQNIKQQMQVNTYDDLLFQALKSITNDNLFNEKIANNGSNIKHLMLDEAQDTNPTSWKIIADIVKKTKCYFFIVGDKKQSIYRFQGARIEEYEKNKTIFADISKQLGIPFNDSVKLSTSYRSTQQILDEADKFCNTPENKQAFTSDENEIIKHYACDQNVNQNNLEKAIIYNDIEVDSADKNKYEEEENNQNNHKENMWKKQTEKLLDKQRKRQQQIDDIASLLYQYIKLDTQYQCDRGKNNGSIAIIYPRGTTKNNIIFDIISSMRDKYKINVIMNTENEKYSIYYNDLIEILNFYVLQNDDINLACLLKSEIFNFNDKMLAEICLSPNRLSTINKTLWSTMKLQYLLDKNEQQKLDFAITNLKQIISCETLGELLDLIEKLMKNAPTNNYLHPFMMIKTSYQKYENQFDYDVRGFLELLKNEKIILPKDDFTEHTNDNISTIYFSTIHGVKGMEFDNVILIDLNSSAKQQNNKLLFFEDCFWYKISKTTCETECLEAFDELNNKIKQQEQQEHNEDLRLHYVAITRAKQRFICITAKK